MNHFFHSTISWPLSQVDIYVIETLKDKILELMLLTLQVSFTVKLRRQTEEKILRRNGVTDCHRQQKAPYQVVALLTIIAISHKISFDEIIFRVLGRCAVRQYWPPDTSAYIEIVNEALSKETFFLFLLLLVPRRAFFHSLLTPITLFSGGKQYIVLHKEALKDILAARVGWGRGQLN